MTVVNAVRVMFTDAVSQYTEVAELVDQDLSEVCRAAGFTGGPQDAAHEEAYALHSCIPGRVTGALGHLHSVRGSFPITERAAAEMISLPIFPLIAPAQQERVADLLISVLSG